MKLSPIIVRLRAQCASFSNRVAGASEFAQAFEYEERLAVPHAFVVPGGIAADEVQTVGTVTQKIDEFITVIICVDNTVSGGGDDRGQASSEALDDLVTEVRDALVGWASTTAHGGFVFQGGDLLDGSRARLWYTLDFVDSRIIG